MGTQNNSLQRSRARDRSESRRVDHQQTVASTPRTMPYGKHRGKLFTEIPVEYLRWMVENFEDNAERREAEKVLCEKVLANKILRGKHRTSKPPRKPTDLSKSHYLWTHPSSGRVLRIPNDVSMEGREGEECPFDLVDEESVWVPECELDVEYLEIIRGS